MLSLPPIFPPYLSLYHPNELITFPSGPRRSHGSRQHKILCRDLSNHQLSQNTYGLGIERVQYLVGECGLESIRARAEPERAIGRRKWGMRAGTMKTKSKEIGQGKELKKLGD